MSQRDWALERAHRILDASGIIQGELIVAEADEIRRVLLRRIARALRQARRPSLVDAS